MLPKQRMVDIRVKRPPRCPVTGKGSASAFVKGVHPEEGECTRARATREGRGQQISWLLFAKRDPKPHEGEATLLLRAGESGAK